MRSFSATGMARPGLAAILFVAAGTKAWQGSTLIPLVEGLWALWLLSGFWSRGALHVSALGFACFFGVSLAKAIAGEASCG
jgi:hypothetical protein